MIDVTEHMGLAKVIVNKIYPRIQSKYEYEDILQIAYLGLTKAANKYDESKGCKFSTYAYRLICGEIFMNVSRDKRFNIARGKALDSYVLSFEQEYETGSVSNLVGNSFEDDLVGEMELAEMCNKLSEKEKAVFKLYFINDLPQKTIGEIINTTQAQVSRLKRRIVKKLEGALNEANLKRVSM
jgi:RNA polymerase sporulation-specific sigma factor